MLESPFEKKCIKQLQKLPNSYWPPKSDSVMIRGIPDRVGCVNGVYCALEFKKSEADSRGKTGRIVLQRKTLADIEKAGGFQAIVYPENWDFVFMEIEHIANTGWI